MQSTTRPTAFGLRRVGLGVVVFLGAILAGPAMSLAQLDLCGCAGNPGSLGDFDTANQASYPPGTTRSNNILTLPLAADGVLIFNSFTVRTIPSVGNPLVEFAANQTNTPVTILVAGDVNIASGTTVTVGGGDGLSGSTGVNGKGGLGGPGAFPGGDGAYQLVNFVSNGGSGVGPGGGSAGTAAPLAPGGNGTFLGVRELLPLVGGSGGGGGASSSSASGCSAGGGGGGGGAILIVANGTITVNGSIVADGGNRGFEASSACSSGGGGGSGGAIRLVANTVTGTGFLFARGGSGRLTFGNPGAVRLEAFTNTMSANNTQPVASRAPSPGPIVNPVTPTVTITSVAGRPVPTPPLGVFGGVDVTVPSPGPVAIALATRDVPSGTTVQVSVKPRVGGDPIIVTPSLDPANCNAAGACTAAVAVDLAAGAYIIEARATFQHP